MDIFEGLSERQREAVETIDDDLEIIACAGAGKTGVVTRRIVNILKLNPGVLPENIVAFTFTKNADPAAFRPVRLRADLWAVCLNG